MIILTGKKMKIGKRTWMKLMNGLELKMRREWPKQRLSELGNSLAKKF